MPAGAMSTTVENAVRLHAMANHTASAMSAFWCNGMNGTLERIEDMRLAIQSHFHAFIILIAANLTHIPFSTHENIRKRLFCRFHGISFLHI
jgi:hypothetical protein